MAYTTQYIGSRYVPQFADPAEWNNTRTYEPLTIVLHEGNSYTSRQFVPVGVDIANDDYWAETGNYNAQVEAYRKEALSFNQQVKVNTENIETIYPLDTIPILNSTKGVTSGGVYSFRQSRSIEDYGCDSSAQDNTDNLQNAINDAASNGYILIIPAKTYTCLSHISIPHNVFLMGVNRHKSHLHFSNGQGLIADVTDSKGYQTACNITFYNFTISGNEDVSTDHANHEPDKSTCGIYGWFSNSCISNINITQFVTGLYTIHPFTSISVYNHYNFQYGDMRVFNNICVWRCTNAIINNEYDTYFSDITVYSITHRPWIGGYKLNGYHSWGTHKGMVITDGAQFSNIEIETQGFQYSTSGATQGNFEGAILSNCTSQGATINNLRIWSMRRNSETPEGGYYHALIRSTSPAFQGPLYINNFEIGTMPDNVLPCYVVDPRYFSTVVVNGIIASSITGTYQTNSNEIVATSGNSVTCMYCNFDNTDQTYSNETPVITKRSTISTIDAVDL